MVYSVYFVKCENKIEDLLGLVWATFWIIFQLVFLAGFATLGIYAFKVAITILIYHGKAQLRRHQLTTEQMDAQAGTIVNFANRVQY